ncbi:M14 family zinc carboxypeptidase [Arsenicicoccus dermatophilus]|uniref:M14 family zinc carboxypeptidase n=1 Tax=Arsenicicoccus dermatophilus TaxID=1076331 RepID=UPI001F4CBE3A|nr:M14 family zinc carboxypeptidase [Arsenicicoccus dermatophilus]MCH8613216.1 DUF2817 domain-containing protein [Arsenicicoccus dermatophilus]
MSFVARTIAAAVAVAVALPATATASGSPARRAVAPEAAARQAGATPALAAVAGPVRETRVIGRTRRGRPIHAYRLGEPGKPVVAVIATMHGNERLNHWVVNGLRTGRPVRGVDLWVVEYVNPDGWARSSRYNAAGVDLNRNFPTAWSSRVPRAGRGPASEPETRALMAFLDRTDPRHVVSLHQPFDGVDTYALKDRALAARLSRQLGLATKSFACSGGCHGTMTQWFNARHRGAAITVEWGRSPTRAQLARACDGVLRAIGGTR